LFEVPLTFANPFGIEVLPTPYSVLVRSARGGRSRQQADEGRPAACAAKAVSCASYASTKRRSVSAHRLESVGAPRRAFGAGIRERRA